MDDLSKLVITAENKDNWEGKRGSEPVMMALDALWVMRNGRDCDHIISQLGLTPEEMEHWEAEAAKAVQLGWFFCAGHKRTEPIEDYGYFYFAGKYCKEWQESHPEDYRRAMGESYN